MNVIIFIHGLGGTPLKTWEKFNNIIKSDKELSEYRIEFYPFPTSLIKFYPWSIFPKIQTLADGLRTFINNRTSTDDKVIIVTHSMGGLIARKYFVEEVKNKCKIRAKKLLLYACPNKGSQLAKLSCLSRITQIGQMQMGSDFINELHNDWKSLSLEKYVQVKYIVGARDKVVDTDSAKYFGNFGDIETVPFKNHRNIVKPKDENDDSFLLFKNFVLQRLKFLVKDYEKPHTYIPRKTIRVTDYDESHFFYIRDQLQVTLFDALLKNNKVVLLAGAGEGKTREIEFLAWYSSTPVSEIYPIKVSLKNYIGGDIEKIFPENWKLLPDDQSLLILDGLDEVESPFKNSAIKSIQHFSEVYPTTKILVTCRTNFYVLPIDNDSGLIEGFEPFWLLPLEYEDIYSFASSSLKNKSEEFLKQVYENGLGEIVKIPFYLINLIEYYRSNLKLPGNIITLLNWLIEKRISADVDHFKGTFDLRKKTNNVFIVLEKIALAMETLGRNYAYETEIDRIIPSLEEKELLNHVGIINCRKGKWEFEHNIFQEFLAAKILSNYKIETIKKFISFPPNYAKIIPSWVNTLSFLSSMYNSDDLITWLLDSQPELLVKFEKDRINRKIRIQITKEIFNYYKRKKIWIDWDKFDLRELGKFASDDESIEFLIEEVTIEQHYTIVGNALELLGYVKNNKEKLYKILLTTSLKTKTEVLIIRSLNALIHQEFDNKDDLDNILQKIDYSQSAHIRSCLYHLIGSAGYANEFVDFFITGIKYIKTGYEHTRGKTTLVDEGFYLARGIEDVTSEESIIKLLEYFIKNPEDLSEVSLSEKTAEIIAKNITGLLKNTDSKIFKLSFKLLIILGDKYLLEHSKKFLICFTESELNMEVFKLVLHSEVEAGLKYRLLAMIANSDAIDYLIEEYNSKKINDHNISFFKNFLAWENNSLLKEFDTKLKNKSEYNEPPPKRNFEEDRNKQQTREIEMFYDKETFIKEIRLVFETENKEELARKDVREIDIKNWENQIYASEALQIIRNFSKNEPIKLEKILNYYNQNDFDFMFVGKIYSILTQNEEYKLDEKYVEKVNKWCYENINDVDFKSALIIRPNKERSTSYKAIYLQYFLKKFNFEYEPNVLLDMLSFDFSEIGIDYLEERIPLPKMKDRILANLKSGKENETAISNYFQFGKKHKMEEMLPFALDSIRNPDLDSATRKSALEFISALEQKMSYLEDLLFEVNDELKWEIVEALIKNKSERLEQFLTKQLEESDEKDNEKAAHYLIELQNIEGLKFFTNLVVNTKKYLPKFYERQVLRSLKIKEAVPYLLTLLEVTYKKEFVQNEFDHLDREVYEALTSISLQSIENFSYVKVETEKFINKYISEYEDINFVYAFLERLEQKFYINKSQNITIEDVLEKLKLIYNS